MRVYSHNSINNLSGLPPCVALWGLLISILLLSTGCIHTYPTPEEAVDPTEINVELIFDFKEEWDAIDTEITENAERSEKETAGTRAENWPRRLYIELSSHNGTREKITRVIEPQEMNGTTYRLQLPSGLKPDEYDVAVWSDYLHPESYQPLAYDISTPALIREIKPRGEETASRNCLTSLSKLDLRHLSGQWDASEESEITLTSPMARFRLVANDYNEFLEQTEEARRHGEKYYVTVSYDSDIPGGFSLHDGLAMDPVSGSEFSTSLVVIGIPGIKMSIASDWLFNPEQQHIHTVSVSVFNSAKAIVSQVRGISFPTQRGKITTVTGKLLTNFITGGIQIDNIWAGEIIIELE